MSRICSELDRDLKAFRDRPLDHIAFPYVFLDATDVTGRVRGRVVPGPWSSSPASPPSATERKQAIGAVLVGSSWQRCRVHFMHRSGAITA